MSGNVPASMKLLKIIDRDLKTGLLHNLIIQIDISSFPCALSVLRALTIFDITSSLKQNEEGVAVDTYCGELGTVLLLTRGLGVEAEKNWYGSFN